jgi:hypothetical protein
VTQRRSILYVTLILAPAHDDATDRLVRGQQVMTDIIAEITRVASEGATRRRCEAL